MSTRAGREHGMTLLEVLIATMLLGVVALIVFSAFGIGLRAASLAGGMNTATGLAEETLATVTSSPCGSSFRLSIPPDAPGEYLARYRREVSVRRMTASNLWELSTTVTWEQQRQRRSVSLATWRYVSAACAFVGQ